MIDADDNPYPAGFGVVPPVLAGRNAEFSDLTAMLRRTAAGRYEEPRLLVGDRSYGTTVLFAELAAQAREPATVTGYQPRRRCLGTSGTGRSPLARRRIEPDRAG